VTESGRATESAHRLAAVGGIVGPAAFIGAWVVAGSIAGGGYSPIDDPISRLAAVGADTRGLMTTGFVAFGLAIPVYAVALTDVAGRSAAVSAAATGVATMAVAALPLGRSASVDTWHGVAAGLGYVTLAATPLLAARPMRRRGWRRLAGAGLAAGVTSLVALGLSATALPTGLFQRLGLSVTDAWIVATAVMILRSSSGDDDG
jgi:Protein of unknown function (DUF998)